MIRLAGRVHGNCIDPLEPCRNLVIRKTRRRAGQYVVESHVSALRGELHQGDDLQAERLAAGEMFEPPRTISSCFLETNHRSWPSPSRLASPVWNQPFCRSASTRPGPIPDGKAGAADQQLALRAAGNLRAGIVHEADLGIGCDPADRPGLQAEGESADHLGRRPERAQRNASLLEERLLGFGRADMSVVQRCSSMASSAAAASNRSCSTTGTPKWM